MSGIILYQSKYGATKKYANWISEETGFSCIEIKKASIREVSRYDVIILGGGIYATGIAGLSFLKKNIETLKDKKIIVFCDGASPYDKMAFQEIVKHNMKGKLINIPCYYCRGAWNMDKMNLIDKKLCKMLRKAIEKKNPDNYEIWEKALMAAGEKACDWTEKKYVIPVIEAIRG